MIILLSTQILKIFIKFSALEDIQQHFVRTVEARAQFLAFYKGVAHIANNTKFCSSLELFVFGVGAGTEVPPENSFYGSV